MGTPDFAVPTLNALVAAKHAIVAVYTQPPRPGGRRGLEPTPSPVHRRANELGIGVHVPASLRSAEEQDRFRAHNADVAVVVAYGLILPKPILDAPRLGAFNLHGSLLPRWRGAAPIPRAIMNGDLETGVMVMRMEEGLDMGPVALTGRVKINADDTTGDMQERLAELGAGLMVQALRALEGGTLVTTPQPSAGVTYARKIDKSEARINWLRLDARVRSQIHGLSPSPGAWTEVPIAGKPERVKILRVAAAKGSGAPGTVLDDQLTVACGSGALRIVELQRAGGKALSAPEFLRGTDVKPGTQFV
jgi:methionyl-tRNA formyltransferase